MNGLKVSFDASAIPRKPAGAGRYCLEIVRSLSQVHQEVSLDVISRKADRARWEELGPAHVASVAPTRRLSRLAYEGTLMSGAIRRLGVDVHHAPHYTMPRHARVPVVVTIHDVTFFERPEVHEPAKVAFFKRAITRASATAGALVCVSAWTADRLAEHVDVSVPVIVAHHGIDHARFTPVEPQPGADQRALKELGLVEGRRRIVTLGTLEPRKGIVSLVEAFDTVAGGDRDVELVIAGQRGWGMEEIDSAIESSAHRDRITLLGYVADSIVPALLRSADLVVYPSVDEGFGLPALEALACGTLLVTTQDSVMAQLCGTAAWLSPPSSAGDLASLISDALNATTEERERRRTLGISTAAGFTWEESARHHLVAYRTAAGS